MTIGVAQSLLALGLLLLNIQGVVCQKLTFKNGIIHDPSAEEVANWTASGRLQLTQQDMIVFEPKVTIQVVTELCSIDLRSCLPDTHISQTPEECFCTEGSDEEYNLFVNSPSETHTKDKKVQATVPSRYLFSPLSLASEIGELPADCDIRNNKGVLPRNFSEDSRVEELENDLSTCEMQKTTLSKELNDIRIDLKTSKEAHEESEDILKEVRTSVADLASLMKSQITKQTNDRKNVEDMSHQIATLTSTVTTLLSTVAELANNSKNVEMSNRIDTFTKSITSLTTDSKDGDDIHASLILNTCADVVSSNPRPVVTLSDGMRVVCDTVTDDGGWYVIQRRASSEVDFYQNWTMYKDGFGNMHGNFWFGLQNIHRLTREKQYELRIDFAFKETDYYAHYDNFTLLGEADGYKLQVSGYSGDAPDNFSHHNGMKFSTKDKENDIQITQHCAQLYHGGWWYRGCHLVNFNGEWGSKAYGRGLNWVEITRNYDSVTFTEMKIRPFQP